MGGIMKGGYAAYSSSSSSSRRRNVYILVMVILMVVFGCGVLGVMGLQRLKDRRILNLLIKDKDDQILSLHHLLQKEREQMHEMKGKTEETKIKVYNLEAQKMELNRRISDMQSTISSLKDEIKTMESAFLEKQNEAEDRYKQVEDRLRDLTQTLTLKDNEIQELKQHHLQTQVDANDQDTKNQQGVADDASRYSKTQSSMHSEDQKPIDEASSGQPHLNHSKQLTTMASETNNLSRISKPRESDGREFGVDKAGVKLQIQDGENFRFRGKNRYVRRIKGKGLRSSAKKIQGKRNSGSNEATQEIGDKLEERRTTPRNDIQNSIMGLRTHNESVRKDDDKLQDAEKGNGEKRSVDAEDMSNKVDIFNEVENGKEETLTNSSSVKPLDEVPKDSKLKNESSGSSDNGAVHHTEGDEQSKLQEHTEKEKHGERNEHPEDIQMDDFEERELGNGTSTESAHSLGEGNDEDKAEPEF